LKGPGISKDEGKTGSKDECPISNTECPMMKVKRKMNIQEP